MMELIEYKNILRQMRDIDNHYCFDCKSNFPILKIISIDKEVYYVCPYCYSKNFVDKSYLESEILKNKYNMNVRYGKFEVIEYIPFNERIESINEIKSKKKKRFFRKLKKIILYEILIIVSVFTFPFSLLGISILIFNHYKKKYVKNNYPKLYKMRYEK